MNAKVVFIYLQLTKEGLDSNIAQSGLPHAALQASSVEIQTGVLQRSFIHVSWPLQFITPEQFCRSLQISCNIFAFAFFLEALSLVQFEKKKLKKMKKIILFK